MLASEGIDIYFTLPLIIGLTNQPKLVFIKSKLSSDLISAQYCANMQLFYECMAARYLFQLTLE